MYEESVMQKRNLCAAAADIDVGKVSSLAFLILNDIVAKQLSLLLSFN